MKYSKNTGRFSKLILLVLFILSGSSFLTNCTKVQAGYVGVKFNQLGSDKGVQNEIVGPGLYFLTPNEQIYTFPTFQQNYTWTANITEGSPTNESISFQTREGLEINADVGVSYSIDPNKVSILFQKYRRGIDEITDIYMHNFVRDAIVRESSKMNVDSLYGPGKAVLFDLVQKDVSSALDTLGIKVEKIYLIGNFRLPQVVVDQLNAKIAATQKAMMRENEVQEARAEADKKRATAAGEAESMLIVAEATAKSMRLQSEAINSNIIEYEKIKKWNGVLPQVQGTTTPLINLSK